MRSIRLLLLAGAASLLGACASAPPAAAPPSLFRDALFKPPAERVSTEHVFVVSEAMKRYLTVDITRLIIEKGAQAGLVEALAKRGLLRLEYDATRTKTAAEAFASRSGNCLSLVLMTAAFAKELNLAVTYQSAYLEETWSRTDGMLFASGHVNITIGRRMLDAGSRREVSPLTIDFLPPEDLGRMRIREISEATVLAMYANNRAVEAITAHRLDDAYAWASEAVRRDPGFIGAYNTLGVIYLRHGDLAEAGQVFGHVLGLQPENTRALSNLAETYARQGRSEAADAARKRLAVLEPTAPFHWFNLGMAAMRRGDWAGARDLFAREVARADYYHEFHFWLAVASSQLGDLPAARKHLALALENSTSSGHHALYSAKLARLKSGTRPQ